MLSFWLRGTLRLVLLLGVFVSDLAAPADPFPDYQFEEKLSEDGSAEVYGSREVFQIFPDSCWLPETEYDDEEELEMVLQKPDKLQQLIERYRSVVEKKRAESTKSLGSLLKELRNLAGIVYRAIYSCCDRK